MATGKHQYRPHTLDGKGDHHGDRTAQNYTAYQPDLNSDEDFIGVVPMRMRLKIPGVVMGC